VAPRHCPRRCWSWGLHPLSDHEQAVWRPHCDRAEQCRLCVRLAARHQLCAPSETLHCESRSEEHTSELQSRFDLVCRILLEKKTSAIRHKAAGGACLLFKCPAERVFALEGRSVGAHHAHKHEPVGSVSHVPHSIRPKRKREV